MSSRSPTFVEELRATIEYTSPTMAVVVMSPIKVSTHYWVIDGGISDNLNTKVPVVDTTLPVDATVPQHMSMEVAVASLHFYIAEVDGISREGFSHTLNLV